MPTNIIKLILLFTPFLLVFQNLFIPELQYPLIAVRYILFPAWIIFNIKNKSDYNWILIGLVYFTLLMITTYQDIGKPFILYLNIISSICYFVFGSNLIIDKKAHLMVFLRHGIDFINISTIAVYTLSLLGIYNIVDFFRDEETMLLGGYENIYDRFSFGNAIETPFMITCLLYCVVLSSRSQSIFLLISIFINLIATFISGSRVMILLSLLLLLSQLGKAYFKYLSGFFICLICFFIYSKFDLFGDLYELLFSRFSSGAESASAIIRGAIFVIFYEQYLNLDVGEILFGNGFESSILFVHKYFGLYMTPESVLIQLLLETGIFGTLIIIPKVIANSFTRNIFSIKGLILIVIYVQLFLLLPIFTYMQIIFLLLGFASNKNFKRNYTPILL